LRFATAPGLKRPRRPKHRKPRGISLPRGIKVQLDGPAPRQPQSRARTGRPAASSPIQTLTVGPGISPDRPPGTRPEGSRALTAGGDFHPAPKKLPTHYVTPRQYHRPRRPVNRIRLCLCPPFAARPCSRQASPRSDRRRSGADGRQQETEGEAGASPSAEVSIRSVKSDYRALATPYSRTVNSILRFLWRPSSVSFVSMGSLSPFQSRTKRSSSRPSATN
jgi:hypothetical protein